MKKLITFGLALCLAISEKVIEIRRHSDLLGKETFHG